MKTLFTAVLKNIPLFLGYYITLIALLYLVQDKLLFIPRPFEFNECEKSYIPNLKTVQKSIEDEGLRYYQVENPVANSIIILFHGNAGAACDRLFYVNELSGLQSNYVIAEYPGYSNDFTPLSQEKILKNALALVKSIISENKSEKKIILFGESLGTGIATYVARLDGVDGLILQAPYPSISDLAADRYWFFPVRFLVKNPFPAFEWADEINPSLILILHSLRDRVIPIEFGHQQRKNFKNEVVFFHIDYYGHNDWFKSKEAKEAIYDYVSRVNQK